MSSEKPTDQNEQGFAIEKPEIEEEQPGMYCPYQRIEKPQQEPGWFWRLFRRPYASTRLPAKDSSAITLAYFCLLVLIGIWLADNVWLKTPTGAAPVIDVLKYVITTSIGFFFGASNKK